MFNTEKRTVGGYDWTYLFYEFADGRRIDIYRHSTASVAWDRAHWLNVSRAFNRIEWLQRNALPEARAELSDVLNDFNNSVQVDAAAA